MNHKFSIKYKIFIGNSPYGEKMMMIKTEYFSNKKDLDKWIRENDRPTVVWLVEYTITKLTPKMKVLKKIKNDNFH